MAAKKKPAPSPSPSPKSKDTAPPASPKEGKAQLTRFQKFEPRRVHRRLIKGAPYNPREIDDFAYARLKKKLETRGLLNALVWNERTGNLVSGHQRLAILDTLEAHDVKMGRRKGAPDDYLLDVDVVRLTPKQEREENVFFNNPSVQGTWNLEKLAALGQLGEKEFDFEAAGFTQMELALTFEGTEFDAIFSPEAQAPEVSTSMATLNEMARARREEAESDDGGADEEGGGDDDVEPYDGAPLPPDEEAPHGRLENGEAIRDPKRHAALIAERDRMREKMKAANEARDPEFFLTIVCRDRAQREALAVALGQHKDTRMIDCMELVHRCKIRGVD